VISSTTIRIQ